MSEDHAAGALIGHPTAARLLRASRRCREWDSRHRWLLDAIVVLAVFLVFCTADLTGRHEHADGPISVTVLPIGQTLALQATLILPLWWRRRLPLTAFAVVLAAFLTQWAAGIILRADAALLVAVYSLVLHGRLRRLPWAIPGLAAALAVVVARTWGLVRVWDVLFFTANVGIAAVAAGFAIRIRRAQLAALRDRAQRLEVERDQRSRLAVATERARVAREMHDILGHSLSVIITLADGGEYAVDVNPGRSKQALHLIGQTGRGSLAELRRMLGVLRDSSDPDPDADMVALHPQPGIGDLDPLCKQIRAAGPQVEYHSAGPLGTLDQGVQLAAYRIVQEALTNALKHAGPATRIRLSLRLYGQHLHITVHNTRPDGAPLPTATGYGSGHGLLGMRERAALYAGTVTAGPTPGGWNVAADLDLNGTLA